MHSAPLQLKREVSAEPAEFRRGLELAFPGLVREVGERLRIHDGAVTLEIALTVGAPRAIGNILLPTLRVNFDFSSGTLAEQRSILAHLDRAMHRGGG